MATYVTNLVQLIGLGIAIDYSLLIVYRFREELERGGVNIVVQPGQWELPRIDHLGLALDEDDFQATLDRAAELELRVQDHGGRRTFVSTNGGFRLEVHPPRDWLDERTNLRTTSSSSTPASQTNAEPLIDCARWPTHSEPRLRGRS